MTSGLSAILLLKVKFSKDTSSIVTHQLHGEYNSHRWVIKTAFDSSWRCKTKLTTTKIELASIPRRVTRGRSSRLTHGSLSPFSLSRNNNKAVDISSLALVFHESAWEFGILCELLASRRLRPTLSHSARRRSSQTDRDRIDLIRRDSSGQSVGVTRRRCNAELELEKTGFENKSSLPSLYSQGNRMQNAAAECRNHQCCVWKTADSRDETPRTSSIRLSWRQAKRSGNWMGNLCGGETVLMVFTLVFL